jgi:hypothetical protein
VPGPMGGEISRMSGRVMSHREKSVKMRQIIVALS